MTKLLTHLKTHPYWGGVRYFIGAGVGIEDMRAFDILKPYIMILRDLHTDIAERKASISQFTTLYKGLKAKDESLLLLGNIEFMLHVYNSPVLDKYEATFPGYGTRTGTFALEKRLEISIAGAKFHNRDQATKYAKFAQTLVKLEKAIGATPEQQINFIKLALSEYKERIDKFVVDQKGLDKLVLKFATEGEGGVLDFSSDNIKAKFDTFLIEEGLESLLKKFADLAKDRCSESETIEIHDNRNIIKETFLKIIAFFENLTLKEALEILRSEGLDTKLQDVVNSIIVSKDAEMNLDTILTENLGSLKEDEADGVKFKGSLDKVTLWRMIRETTGIKFDSAVKINDVLIALELSEGSTPEGKLIVKFLSDNKDSSWLNALAFDEIEDVRKDDLSQIVAKLRALLTASGDDVGTTFAVLYSFLKGLKPEQEAGVVLNPFMKSLYSLRTDKDVVVVLKEIANLTVTEPLLTAMGIKADSIPEGQVLATRLGWDAEEVEVCSILVPLNIGVDVLKSHDTMQSIISDQEVSMKIRFFFRFLLSSELSWVQSDQFSQNAAEFLENLRAFFLTDEDSSSNVDTRFVYLLTSIRLFEKEDSSETVLSTFFDTLYTFRSSPIIQEVSFMREIVRLFTQQNIQEELSEFLKIALENYPVVVLRFIKEQDGLEDMVSMLVNPNLSDLTNRVELIHIWLELKEVLSGSILPSIERKCITDGINIQEKKGYIVNVVGSILKFFGSLSLKEALAVIGSDEFVTKLRAIVDAVIKEDTDEVNLDEIVKTNLNTLKGEDTGGAALREVLQQELRVMIGVEEVVNTAIERSTEIKRVIELLPSVEIDIGDIKCESDFTRVIEDQDVPLENRIFLSFLLENIATEGWFEKFTTTEASFKGCFDKLKAAFASGSSDRIEAFTALYKFMRELKNPEDESSEEVVFRAFFRDLYSFRNDKKASPILKELAQVELTGELLGQMGFTGDIEEGELLVGRIEGWDMRELLGIDHSVESVQSTTESPDITSVVSDGDEVDAEPKATPSAGGKPGSDADAKSDKGSGIAESASSRDEVDAEPKATPSVGGKPGSDADAKSDKGSGIAESASSRDEVNTESTEAKTPSAEGELESDSDTEAASADTKIVTLSRVLEGSGLSQSFQGLSSESKVSEFIFNRELLKGSRVMLKFLWDSVETDWITHFTPNLGECFEKINAVFDINHDDVQDLGMRFATLYKSLQRAKDPAHESSSKEVVLEKFMESSYGLRDDGDMRPTLYYIAKLSLPVPLLGDFAVNTLISILDRVTGIYDLGLIYKEKDGTDSYSDAGSTLSVMGTALQELGSSKKGISFFLVSQENHHYSLSLIILGGRAISFAHFDPKYNKELSLMSKEDRKEYTDITGALLNDFKTAISSVDEIALIPICKQPVQVADYCALSVASAAKTLAQLRMKKELRTLTKADFPKDADEYKAFADELGLHISDLSALWEDTELSIGDQDFVLTQDAAAV